MIPQELTALDHYGDGMKLLVGTVPVDEVPDFVKAASVNAGMKDDQGRALDHQDFGLVIHEGGDFHCEFPRNDPGNTALSTHYFLHKHASLPAPVVEKVAHRLAIGCRMFGLDIPEPLLKLAGIPGEPDLLEDKTPYTSVRDLTVYGIKEKRRKFSAKPRNPEPDSVSQVGHKDTKLKTSGLRDALLPKTSKNPKVRAAAKYRSENDVAHGGPLLGALRPGKKGKDYREGLEKAKTSSSRSLQERAMAEAKKRPGTHNFWLHDSKGNRILHVNRQAPPSTFGKSKTSAGIPSKAVPASTLKTDRGKVVAPMAGATTVKQTKQVPMKFTPGKPPKVAGLPAALRKHLADGALGTGMTSVSKGGDLAFAKATRHLQGQAIGKAPAHLRDRLAQIAKTKKGFYGQKKTAGAQEHYKHWSKEGPSSLPAHHSQLKGKDRANFASYLKSEQKAVWAPKTAAYDVVANAARDFNESWMRVDVEDRVKIAQALVSDCDALGIDISDMARTYSEGVPNHEKLKVACQVRKAYRPDAEIYDELIKAAELEALDGPEMVSALWHADEETGLSRLWDSKLQDPFLSCMHVKTAEETDARFVIGNDHTGERELKRLAVERRDLVTQAFGEIFAEKFQKNPVTIFKSLPDDSKKILARMASGHSLTEG